MKCRKCSLACCAKYNEAAVFAPRLPVKLRPCLAQEPGTMEVSEFHQKNLQRLICVYRSRCTSINTWTPSAERSQAWMDVGVWCCNVGGEPSVQTWTLTALDPLESDCLDRGRAHRVTDWTRVWVPHSPFDVSFHSLVKFLPWRTCALG